MVHSRTATVAGTERHILGVSRELVRLGHSVTIACPAVAEPLRQSARAQGFGVIDERAATRHRGVDVVHAHDGRSMLAAVAATTGRRRVALVRTQHFVAPASTERSGGLRVLSQLGHRGLNSRADGYVCVSDEAARAAVARGEVTGPVTVIPPGVEIPDDATWERSVHRRRDTADAPVILSAGRLDAERSFDTLIRTIGTVCQALPRAQFVIAGDGEVAEELKALADRLGVAPAIRWPGWVSELQSVLGTAHLYVNTWPAEGFGMATAEAMAAGVPVIVPASGAAPELIAGGVGGWTVPPRDPAALGARICEVLTTSDTLAHTGARARVRAAERYSAVTAAAQLAELYASVLEARAGA